MNEFCVTKISIAPLLRARHGIIDAAGMALTLDARAAAAAIVDEARREAEALHQEAQRAARAAVLDAEQQAMLRSAALLGELERRHAALLDGAQDMVIDLALALFDQALARTTPRERIAANYQRLLQETQRDLVRPVLCLHPDDSGLTPGHDWEIRIDATLRPGACRLEAGNGEWHCDFDQGVAALKAAFTAAARQPDPAADHPTPVLPHP